MPNAIAIRRFPHRIAQVLGTAAAIALGTFFLPAQATLPVFPEYVATISRVAPPREIVEPQPAAKPGHTWSPGYWRYDGLNYEWVAGSYVKDRSGLAWHAPRWTLEGGRWHFVVGHWERKSATKDKEKNS